jgi:hypothetical protein
MKIGISQYLLLLTHGQLLLIIVWYSGQETDFVFELSLYQEKTTGQIVFPHYILSYFMANLQILMKIV